MNIQQLSEIHYFYTCFLAKIRKVETLYIYRDKSEEEKKTELLNWLIRHKTLKTFGDSVRHEIFHMLELVSSENTHALETKIGNLEHNCKRIHVELEREALRERPMFIKNTLIQSL
ncbi:hypothetical protein [Candidatus Pantoea multigeneris]|uniref:Uncharacterized protein n=1 Tax=Candidatus Pantoea multigeneris TaxID=2608357 RepID=A0ABX0REQ3_9GAMM|nr:hypothetical protein [Pantoea multigeneris]NIF23835.1 hypothetical protein [Pantoea multigeneris]